MGPLLLRGAVAPQRCADWLVDTDARYAAVSTAADADPDFSVFSSSVRLSAVEGLGWEVIWPALEPALWPLCHAALGADFGCAAEHCWVRRQYAPGHAPPRHAAHSWHQDGALGFDFPAHAGMAMPADAMPAMLTCWIALTPCGVDAPGLELVTSDTLHLLAPGKLEDAALRARTTAGPRSWRPRMAAGDALVFDGSVLHRTHVASGMTRDRTSVELRFFDPRRLPGRLQHLRFNDGQSEVEAGRRRRSAAVSQCDIRIR